MDNRKAYPSDVSDDEWAFIAPYLTLMREDAPQREHNLREVFNGLRWIIRTGAQWRMLPNDLPPWYPVHQQAQRWLAHFRRLARDYERLPQMLPGLHFLAFACLLLTRVVALFQLQAW